MGTPKKWTERMRKSAVNKIVHRIAQGRSLTSIMQELGDELPDVSTFYDWLHEDEEIAAKYERARSVQAESFIDGLVDTAHNEPDVQRAKLLVDTKKWVASKMIPKKYGDKIDHDVSGNVTVIIETGLPESKWKPEEEQDDADEE